VVVLMSGGVDSSVAAVLLREQGYEVTGVTMKLLPGEFAPARDPRLCCVARAVSDAGEVARRIGIPHRVVDVVDAFHRAVIEPFVNSYRCGETPNPCVRCNRVIKFGVMLRHAEKMGTDLIATGHYARIIPISLECGGSPPPSATDVGHGGLRPHSDIRAASDVPPQDWGLFRARDRSRDQSYFLCGIPAPRLPQILFPLGNWGKGDVRRYAEQHDLPVAAKPQSQEICFTSGEDYRLLAGGDRPGRIVHTDSRVLGSHPGVSHFTVGQRRGLRLGGGGAPLYVVRIEPETATVFVGPRESLLASNLAAVEPNYLATISPGQPVTVQIRSQMRAVPARVTEAARDRLAVRFDRPVSAVTPGQFAVLYDGDRVLGAGKIGK